MLSSTEINTSRDQLGAEFVDRLERTARAHRALNHPWLARIREGSLPYYAEAVADFAANYFAYSRAFPEYLRTVIARLSEPRHRELLEENLAEEQGELGEDDRRELIEHGIDVELVDGVRHSQLFRQFCDAIGANIANAGNSAGQRWSDALLTFLHQASPAAAVGALGLGTEGVVKHIYRDILDGLAHHTDLTRADYVFFELHALVDDQHAADLAEIAAELASTPTGRREMRRGMRFALDLRARFWDAMIARADAQEQVA